jgi:hypothetical protein
MIRARIFEKNIFDVRASNVHELRMVRRCRTEKASLPSGTLQGVC